MVSRRARPRYCAAALLGAGAIALVGATSPASAVARRNPPGCGNALSTQVLLDRKGFSPGEIDGRIGPNVVRALSAFQRASALGVSGRLDCATWHALGGDESEPAIKQYTIDSADLEGPFVRKIPPNLVEQATLPELEYRSALEKLAERFHASPSLLLRLNRGRSLVTGATFDVPAVEPFDPAKKPQTDAAGGEVSVDVSRSESSLRVTDGSGSVLFFAPVSIGSSKDPLPVGQWQVSAVQWRPQFHYNPALFWDAKPTDSKVAIKPGPNNPVGVVWIGVNLDHYGLHGTPEPSLVGHGQSHGCVRLTNWDAARVATFVKRGTPVIFR